MIVHFSKLLYPRGIYDGLDYAVGIYRPVKPLVTKSGKKLHEISVVGYGLPTSSKLAYDIKGVWKTGRYGPQLELTECKEVIEQTKEGIIAFLASGQIKGIGQKTAERIYDMFGNDTLAVLDTQIDQLSKVKGISQQKLEKIKTSYIESRGARDIISFLAPHNVPVSRCVRLFKEYGPDTMRVITQHPYQLCELDGFGFRLADEIAKGAGLDPYSPERVSAAILQALKDCEKNGSICTEKHKLVELALTLLNTQGIDGEYVAAQAYHLCEANRLITRGDMCYRHPLGAAEADVAKDVYRLIKANGDFIMPTYIPVSEAIRNEEEKLGMQFDPEQKTAIGVALSCSFSIITGGPGTGKTSIERAILDIYREYHPDAKIYCCAPTGRAARRMEEATGIHSTTIHKMLQLQFGDDGMISGTNDPQALHDADLILVDEVSMIDIWVAKELFHAIDGHTQIVLIGDADQLPSVGPGAILGELLQCEYLIPITRLDKVHRQSAGSSIAVNARAIRHGQLNLTYDDDFQLIEESDITVSADRCCELYLRQVAKYGVDQVCMLTPFRRKTATGANNLNMVLRDLVNPASKDKPEITVKSKVYRMGDKLMQLKNTDLLANGDCGYITNISKDDDGDVVVTIDFGDGRIIPLYAQALEDMDFAYATTIHKAQGTEFKSVICNFQKSQYVMLKRPLLYTGITRAKEQVIIVGEKRAVEIAIKNLDTQKRGTMLADRIFELDHADMQSQSVCEQASLF